MKIMSLNVNRFAGMKNKAYTDTFTSLGECPKANEIAAYVEEFLNENIDGVVFLYEIPYKNSQGRGNDFKWLSERQLYKSFRSRLEGQYEISSPGQNAYSCTLAIWNKKRGWVYQNGSFGRPAASTNKYVELKSANLRLMGIHAPGDYQFLEDIRKYAEAHKNENLIIFGDFNIATNEWRAKKHKEQMEKGEKVAECKDFFERRKWLLETMPSIGYSDIVDREKPTYFWQEKGQLKETTVDHVLVSLTLKDKVTVDVKRYGKYELSDHAVIIVDIEE